MTRITTQNPNVLARYNIAPPELTLMKEKGIGVVTLDGPLADITAFWQGPSLKEPTMAALIGQKGSASPSFFGATTKEGQRYNFVFTSDSAQAAQLGLGMTVGTPNLNTQWLSQFRVATVGDTLRLVSTSAHPNTRYGKNPQLEFVTTGGSGARIPRVNINLFGTAVLSVSTKVNVGEIGVTTLKEAAPRRLYSVTGVPIGKAPLHSAGYGKDEGQFGYVSKYNNIVEPNYVLREAKKNPAELASDPFAALQPPTGWLKENTFDVFVVKPGKMLIDPVTNGTQWLINELRTKASDAIQGGYPKVIERLVDQAGSLRSSGAPFPLRPESVGPNFRSLELSEIEQTIDGQKRVVGFIGTGPVELDPGGNIVTARGKQYELLEPDGTPITNVDRARERAQELIHWGAATDLTYEQADKLQADREAFSDELDALMGRLPSETRLETDDRPEPRSAERAVKSWWGDAREWPQAPRDLFRSNRRP